MKILIDARMYGLENSGIGRYIINLTDELKNLGIEQQFLILLRKKYFDELKFPKNWRKILADFRHYTFEEQLKLPRIIDKEKPDLVHFPHINIALFYNGPYVVTVHDMTMYFQGSKATTLPLYKYLLKRLPFKFIFKQAVIKSKKILTPSQTVKAQIVDFFKIDPEKIAVTYEGIDKRYAFGKKGSRELAVLAKFKLVNANYFFYVGNAYPHKNLEIVLHALADLNQKRGISTQFVVAGSRDLFMERLRKLIDKQNIANVKLIGFVRDDELDVLYRNSLGFIYPSLSEGFGLQGIEAISSGTILLASNISIFREIYEGHAFYFNPKDVFSISGTMYSVANMKREDKYKYLLSAQEFIKKYSWQKMAKETYEVYKEVLNQI